MKKVWFILILRQVSLWLLIGAVSACSFKKEPVENEPIAPVQKNIDALTESPENLFLSSPEEDLVKILEDRKVPFLESLNIKEQSLLDLAIKHSKEKIMEHLLSRGFNPLLVNEHSQRILETKSSYRNIVTSFQKPIFYKFLMKNKSPLEPSKFNSELESMRFQTASCRDFVRLALDLYYHEPTVRHSYAVPDMDLKAVPQIIQEVFRSQTCKSLQGAIASEELKSWLSGELFRQAQVDFASVDFARFILSIGSVENYYLESFKSGLKVKIDPRLFMILNWSSDEAETLTKNRQQWIALLEKIVSNDPHFYNYKYTTTTNEGEGPVSCEEYFCYADNETTIAAVVQLMNPAYKNTKEENKKDSDE